MGKSLVNGGSARNKVSASETVAKLVYVFSIIERLGPLLSK